MTPIIQIIAITTTIASIIIFNISQINVAISYFNNINKTKFTNGTCGQSWYADSAKWSEFIDVNGNKIRHGNYQCINRKYSIKILDVNYHYGLKNGPEFEWDTTGKLIRRTEYNMGVKNGLEIISLDSGTTFNEYSNGEKKWSNTTNKTHNNTEFFGNKKYPIDKKSFPVDGPIGTGIRMKII